METLQTYIEKAKIIAAGDWASEANLQTKAGVWWAQQRSHLKDEADDQALLTMAFMAPNLASVFNVAYQFALKHMFQKHCADVFAKNEQLCLCVSEKSGNSPKNITTQITNESISGYKTFVTVAPYCEHLLVLLDKNTGKRNNDKKNLRLALIRNIKALPPEQFQVHLSGKPASFLPEIEKGHLELTGLQSKYFELLEGDGHQDFSKPFSVVESYFIRLALCAFLLKLALILNWRSTLIADIYAQLNLLHASLNQDISAPDIQLILDSHARAMDNILSQVESALNEAPEKIQQYWKRDKLVFYMDVKLRPLRLKKALNTLGMV